jgi:hypothetical protein
MQDGRKPAEEASAVAQYKSLGLTKYPRAVTAGEYKRDPHHTSVVAKNAHMDLSHYTLRFDSVSGGFVFDPSHATASNMVISIDPQSIDTGDQALDKKIAKQYFEIDQYPRDYVYFIDGEDHRRSHLCERDSGFSWDQNATDAKRHLSWLRRWAHGIFWLSNI